jgi:hypothetical protein
MGSHFSLFSPERETSTHGEQTDSWPAIYLLTATVRCVRVLDQRHELPSHMVVPEQSFPSKESKYKNNTTPIGGR